MAQSSPDPLRLARSALEREPAGLVTDLDGTLAAIVSDPAAVHLADGAADALGALAARLALVAVATGRRAADARRILGRDDVLVIGNHGLEWLPPGDTPVAVPRNVAVARALSAIPRIEGLVVEDKGLSATLHFRNAPDPEAARNAVEAALATAVMPGITVRRGRMSLELRQANRGDKGTALDELVATAGLRGLVVLGDDLTDLDMFRAAARLRADGRVAAAILAVGGGREVPPEVAAGADAVLDSPVAVVRFLRALGDAASLG